ncbi:RagB/SusD family nutrient uptake outer membrane protein [Marinilabilia sp.]|uniref:RagB/SusD family nutrient uptake outer membrane protein n=1 Tax=Marinilabilia sp. TaxID=2021252 RepID=UPI0025C463C5|nr:RagB/SusD family nutrient uptake outer membrane protein [Marinilabilia sp.]
MKRNRIFLLMIPALLLVLTPACKDEFLEVDPAGKLSSEVFPQTDEEIYSAIIGGYAKMQWNYGRDWQSAFVAKVLAGDDANAAGGGSGDQTPYQNIDDFVNESDNPVTSAIWEGFYHTVNHSNTIIERVEPSNALRERVIAEAKAMRAWSYLELVSLYGDVPFYTVNPTNAADYHKPRTPKADIYAQIETDLKDAMAVLPLKSELEENELFRISKGAAQAMLGKAYLYQEKWDLAHVEFQKLIDSPDYELEENFSDVWKRVSEYGDESVFEIAYTSHEGYDWGTFAWGGLDESNIHIQLMGPRAPFFSNLDVLGIIPGWGFNLPTAKIGNAFADAGDNGPRYQASLMSEAEFLAAGGSIVADTDDEGNQVPAWDYEKYLRLKYATYASETNTADGVVAELNYTTNWRLIRYADVLLMAAEAYNEDGDPGTAIGYVNEVRERAELPLLSGLGQGDLREAIKLERQLELAFEGARYTDLVRWGDAAEELAGDGFQTGRNELWPIPLTEISANNEIEQEDQNPGY